eukprot:979711_1
MAVCLSTESVKERLSAKFKPILTEFCREHIRHFAKTQKKDVKSNEILFYAGYCDFLLSTPHCLVSSKFTLNGIMARCFPCCQGDLSYALSKFTKPHAMNFATALFLPDRTYTAAHFAFHSHPAFQHEVAVRLGLNESRRSGCCSRENEPAPAPEILKVLCNLVEECGGRATRGIFKIEVPKTEVDRLMIKCQEDLKAVTQKPN